MRFGAYAGLALGLAVGCSTSNGGTVIPTGAAGAEAAGSTGSAGVTATGAAGAGAAGTGAAGTTSGGAGTTGGAGLGAAGSAAGAGGSATGGTSGAAGAGTAGAGTAGMAAAGASGIEQIDLTPTPSTGCGKAPDLTGSQTTSSQGTSVTIVKKGASYAYHDGTTKMGEYIIELPASYNMNTPTKLGLSMAGYTRDSLDCLYGDCWGFAAEGHKDGAIVVQLTQVNPGQLHPPQTGDPNNAPVQTGWELSNELADNVSFFKGALADIEANYCVDTKHIFVAGGSSGGDMALYLGCWMGDVLRGVASVGGCMANTIAPVAGTSPLPAPKRGDEDPDNICLKTVDFSVCKGSVAVVMVHGYKDPHIPWADARITHDKGWVPKNACGSGATTPMSLDAIHTAVSTAGGTEIVCGDSPGCAADYPVRWCEHNDGGYDGSTHGWPAGGVPNVMGDGAGKFIWDFWTSLR